jgi:hypothetical protein
VSAEPAGPTEAALYREIARTREDLGETVAALVAKADVKERMSQRVTRLRRSPVTMAGLAAGALIGLAAIVWSVRGHRGGRRRG